MRPVRLRCPNPRCRLILSIPTHMRGRRVRCAACGHQFVAPVLPGGALGRRHYRDTG
ncbi:MAG: BRcat domain-containing protein [Planctomycetota bacterium]